MSVSRRTFQLSMAGAAAAAFGRAQPAPDKKIGYAIIGLGRISMGEFMPGLRESQTCKVAALVSGHRDKALQEAQKYGVPESSIYSYDQVEKLKDNPDVDAVYVALPNNMHAEYTIRAARAGKHVLCEKPMAVSSGECREMIAACKATNRKLLIAYRCRYEPNHLKAEQTVRSGRIGKLEMVDSSFGFSIKAGEWRLSKKMAGGGPLMDVGIYSLQACRMLAGEEPVEVSATWSKPDADDPRFKEVEENLVWTMRFPSGLLTTCSTSYATNTGGYFRGFASKGTVAMEPAFSYEGLKLSISSKDETIADSDPHQFTREAEHLAECIRENKEPKTAGEEGLRDLVIMEAIYRSCQEARPAKLA